MARARGANATMAGAFETTYGTAPATGYQKLAFSVSELDSEIPLVDDDLLGFGREMQDPTQDPIDVTGDVTVPLCARQIGIWLRLLLGDAVTTRDADSHTHVFTSGAASLPSIALEIGNPEVPFYALNKGCKVNTLAISLTRKGLLSGKVSLIAQNQTSAAASAGGTATALEVDRFAQATGAVKKGAASLGSVVSADITLTNNFDTVEVLRGDGLIDGADEGLFQSSGNITVRFADTIMLDAATSGTPVALSYGWAKGNSSLLFALPRVFLPKPKKSISGPNGIQAQFAWKSSGQGGHALTATLVNDVEAY